MICCILFFFFKQKTAYEMRISDWSSDVCSSDLQREHGDERRLADFRPRRSGLVDEIALLHGIFHCWSLSWVVWKTSNSVHAVACAWVLLENECRIGVGLRMVHGRRGHTCWQCGYTGHAKRMPAEIGRASCWERVCPYV